MKLILNIVSIVIIGLVGCSRSQTRSSTRYFAGEHDGTSGLIYKTVEDDLEYVFTVNPQTGKFNKFIVPEKAKTPVLMRHGICVPCTDGAIILFTPTGTRQYEERIKDTSILQVTRVSDDKLVILGTWWNKNKQQFDLTIKLLNIRTDGISTKEIGVVSAPGKLVPSDECTVWWIRGKESKMFTLCD